MLLSTKTTSLLATTSWNFDPTSWVFIFEQSSTGRREGSSSKSTEEARYYYALRTQAQMHTESNGLIGLLL
jgi:hypothetical protein